VQGIDIERHGLAQQRAQILERDGPWVTAVQLLQCRQIRLCPAPEVDAAQIGV
jgi:hypothetical protein